MELDGDPVSMRVKATVYEHRSDSEMQSLQEVQRQQKDPSEAGCGRDVVHQTAGSTCAMSSVVLAGDYFLDTSEPAGFVNQQDI